MSRICKNFVISTIILDLNIDERVVAKQPSRSENFSSKKKKRINRKNI